ncbi:hypothetical protein B2G71_17980 [Novosphingobium sp. PC22D]|uniref:hypothetical protein n=1 Tax=Novosphingobium sp. PC22D TaxID=1962403 RepID=UPI000BF111BE|nr:hypothetical protein [Novosphingobium sp. PC22D]PEQ11181.1 hypothetical protein B2G71_17980 [Novosphingobium sp. PC22D]
MRNAVAVALIATLMLGACGQGPEKKARKAADAEQDVAMVERMNQIPFTPILPQPFSRADIARYDLARGCVFRLEKGDEPIFVAQSDRGYLKLDGELQPVAAKAGSAELPSGARSIYIGLDHWVELVAQAGEGGDADSWPSRLVIHDAQERVAFDKLGRVTCAA